MTDMLELIREIAKSPGMYVGQCDLYLVRAFLDGYDWALRQHGIMDYADWHGWIEVRFQISDTAWGWPRIVLNAYGDHLAAITAMPILYEEYLHELAEIGSDGIAAKRSATVSRLHPTLFSLRPDHAQYTFITS